MNVFVVRVAYISMLLYIHCAAQEVCERARASRVHITAGAGGARPGRQLPAGSRARVRKMNESNIVAAPTGLEPCARPR